MKYKKAVAVAFVAATLAGLVGCRFFEQPTLPSEEPETLEERNSAWVEVIRQVGLVPILPPREDVRVGDIYVYPVDPEGESASAEASRLSALSRWSAVPVLEKLDSEYKERRAWPRTPEGFLQVAQDLDSRAWPEAVEESDTSVFSPEAQPKRLRLFGLTPFASMTFTSGDLNRLIPSEVVNVILGTAWRDVKTITLRPRGAESYSLSMAGLIDLLLDEIPGGERTAYGLKDEYRRHLSFVADAGSESVWIRVISEVLYFRALDIIVQTEEEFDEDDAVQASELTAVDTEPESSQSARTTLGAPSTTSKRSPSVADHVGPRVPTHSVPDRSSRMERTSWRRSASTFSNVPGRPERYRTSPPEKPIKRLPSRHS